MADAPPPGDAIDDAVNDAVSDAAARRSAQAAPAAPAPPNRAPVLGVLLVVLAVLLVVRPAPRPAPPTHADLVHGSLLRLEQTAAILERGEPLAAERALEGDLQGITYRPLGGRDFALEVQVEGVPVTLESRGGVRSFKGVDGASR